MNEVQSMNSNHLKRGLSLLLALSMVFLLCACGMFDKDYSVVADYNISDDTVEEGTSNVHNYYELEQAVLALVDGHEEQGVLKFESYDGDISTDLESVAWELRKGDALCAYCVRNIAYELRHIVSYDEATISISYSRTAEDVANIVRVAYSTDMGEYLESAIDSFTNKLVLLVNNSALDEDGVGELALSTYEEDPLIAVNVPKTTVKMYSGDGSQRLFEIYFSYNDDTDSLHEKKSELGQRVSEIAEQVRTDSTASTLLDLSNYLAAASIYDERLEKSSAYDVLFGEESDSYGFALALKAICNQLDVDCEVVYGYLNQADHWWNIVRIEDDYYHIDITKCSSEGTAAGFLLSDEEMWTSYRWDTSKYSECNGPLTYAEVAGIEEEQESA